MTAPESASANGDRNVWSEYEIASETSIADRPQYSLKDGEGFVVLDSRGDMGAVNDTPEGLFFKDTRYLSRFEMRIGGRKPLLLSAAVHQDKPALTFDLTNRELVLAGETLRRDTIAVERTKFFWRAVAYERIKVCNYGQTTARFSIDIRFGSDFRDLFEVRGMRRPDRGEVLARIVDDGTAELAYRGLDGVERLTAVRFNPVPTHLTAYSASWSVELAPGERTALFVDVACGERSAVSSTRFLVALHTLRRERRALSAGAVRVSTSNELFDEVLGRARSDVYAVTTATPLGPYPYAGIPWFSTMFGRDGIITAMLFIWVDPTLARGVLENLAMLQASHNDPAADAEPGKILHEVRHGEMANLGEVPFRRYYGSVDSTPLFVWLAGQYLERSGDLETISRLWPNIEAAIRWIDTYGDRDGDGFVEYLRERESGLANQGWKDSHDAIFHADGTGATGPIALCEVQAYVYAAKQSAGTIAAALGRSSDAARLHAEAEALRVRFEDAFWCEELGTYALALDGAKRPCRVRASNAGHALMAGIAAPERAARVAAALMRPDSFSGWGIRTVATHEARYNPVSYHNGSVWPHDNAMIALGFARYGLKMAAVRVLEALFHAATHQDDMRLPELFCGFQRKPYRGPTAYPVACAPQAWAAASVFGALGACLGLELRQLKDEIHFSDPVMPDFVQSVALDDLALGASRVSLCLHRQDVDVTVNVRSRHGTARVVVTK